MINPNVSVDCVVFGFDGQRLNALLIEQEDLGQDHRFALPGDHLQDEESLDEAASRAFDHNDIFNRALGTLRKALKDMQVGFKLLPEKFTLTQMQSVHEVILRTTFDKRNFRKKVINDNWVIPLEEKQTGVYHKPARLYRWSNKA